MQYDEHMYSLALLVGLLGTRLAQDQVTCQHQTCVSSSQLLRLHETQWPIGCRPYPVSFALCSSPLSDNSCLIDPSTIKVVAPITVCVTGS